MRARGVSGKLRVRRQTRHWGEAVRTTDDNNRPGIARALGIDDALEGPPEHDVDACMTFGCECCLRVANGGGR